MKRISTIEFSASLEELRSAVASGSIPPGMLEPLQSLVTQLIKQITEQPTGVYLLSSDQNKELRDMFGACLALALLPQFKTTLLIDADFLNVGMGGIVPQKDSLGFLDLLLYGSSMKAIVQRSEGGVNVIGAGSFQVPKKLPFSIESFQRAVRYLLNQAHCAIFSGPAEDDTGTVQPMAESLKSIIYIRQTQHAVGMPLDNIETKLTPLDDASLFAVNVLLERGEKMPEMPVISAEPLEPPEPPTAPEPPAEEMAPEVTEAVPDREQPVGATLDAGKDLDAPTGAATETPENLYTWETVEDRSGRTAKNSLFAKIAMGVVPIILIAFLFWWLFYTKQFRGEGTAPTGAGEEQAAVLTDTSETASPLASGDTSTVARQRPESGEGTGIATRPDGEESPAAEPPPTTEQTPRETEQTPREVERTAQPVEPAVERQGETGPAVLGEHGLAVYENLRAMAGSYLIHISSFRAIANAKQDAEYLLGRGFDVFVARMNLGSKGIWYRVYAGPYATRDEARTVKLNLDTVSRVKFTRITKVPQ